MQIFVPWVHILSFSVWLSANLFVLALVCPATRGLPSAERGEFMRRAAGALNRVAAVAAPLTVLSGLGGFFLQGGVAQLSPGFGTSIVLAAKILLTAVMALHHGLQAFRHGAFPEQPLDSRNPWMRLLAANVILGTIVLLLGLGIRRVAM